MKIRKILKISLIIFGAIFVTAIGLTLLGGFQAKQDLTKKYPPSGKMVLINGKRIHYRILGQGAITLILEAGQNESSLTWCRVETGLSRFCKVFMYDRPGLGWSDLDTSPLSATTVVEDLHQLLLEEGINGPYIFAGHSMGGLYVKAFAAKYPDNILGLVFIDSAHESQEDEFSAVQQNLILKYRKDLVQQFRDLSTLTSLGLLAMDPKSIPVNPLYTGKAASEYRALLAMGPRVFNGMIRETASQPNIYEELKQAKITGLDVPIIIMRHAKPSPLVPGTGATVIEETERVWTDLQNKISLLNDDHVVIEAKNSGHYIQLDEPQLVVDSIHDMIKRIEEN